MDFMGPFKPPSSNGNKYIMVVTDYFSKYVEVRALPDQTAITTADAFLEMIVRRHGTPKAIVSDRGVNFTSKIFQRLCKSLGIKQKLATSYHPATNGETERFNRTLTMLLRKELIDSQHGDWEEMLGDVCFAYHSSVHSSTQETPFFLLYGRDPNVPIHNLLGAIPRSKFPASDFVSLRMESLSIAFQRTKEENSKAREQQRKQYNKRASELRYQVGDRVLLDVKVRTKEENKKFISKYRGPFRVSRVYTNETVDIMNNSFVSKRVHVNRLRPLYDSMIWRDEFCPEFEDATVFPTSPVPAEREEQADGVVQEADNRPATPEAGNNDPATVEGDAELLVPFHGWDQIDSDQPPAVNSLPLDKEVNEEPPPLPQLRIERNRRVTKVPKRLIEEK
jgi:hypothetical protein